MILQTEVLDRTQQFVESLLNRQLPAHFTYHNLKHTKEVVAAAQVIGTRSQLSEHDLETVLLAAWLHDTGYCFRIREHEEESIRLAKEILTEQQVEEVRLNQVVGCIAATRYPQQPQNILEEVLCDADMYHTASEEYMERAEQLRHEIMEISKCVISRREWAQNNREFLKNHRFFTEFGQTEMEVAKQKNAKKLKKMLKEMEEDYSEFPMDVEETYKQINRIDKDREKEKDKEKQEKKKDKKKKDPNTPVRGIETMFRTMSANHLELSSIADNKANIMISINSIILSIIVSVLGRKLEEYPNFTIPTLILTLVCLGTIIFAVLATRPNVTSGIFTKEDVYKKRTNLLFFGNFHSMKLDDYEWGIKEMMKDSDYLYGSMIRDNYFLGKVLGKKYRLLRIAYTIFMFGLVVAILSYGVAIVFFPV
ncbi:HD domain-containing protein [Rhodocytophaga rosea]|uniref:HD domain-containing protein n=1 Tax=Rhodocytophaga rosea TaxID=2704465 RepID=A0A6C0GEU2_9BACT|nr:Pycsar system effector family protein [Rhodocytophaga rosea]QHT66486.1 HD domain-containing protein [Rhodocytophaga rosea]